MKQNNGYDIASNMDSILKDPEYTSIFSSSAVLEKLAFKRVADEDKPTEIEVELSTELMNEPLKATADNARADCLVCGKKRVGWTESDGVCKCAKENGCNPMTGCKEGCDCGCKTKKAGVDMNDVLIKSAFDSLMSASSDLEEAGFEHLSANALILMNHLIVEAKKAKDKKKEKGNKSKAELAKEKADAAKAKAKMLAAKEKDQAKAAKEKERAAKEKEKAKMDANNAKDRDAKAKAKAKMEALRALKDKKSGK